MTGDPSVAALSLAEIAFFIGEGFAVGDQLFISVQP